MSEPKRYTNTRPTPMFPDDNGDFVQWADYEKLTAINAELLAACESAVWARFACPYDATNPNGAREKLKAAIANTQPQGELNDDD